MADLPQPKELASGTFEVTLVSEKTRPWPKREGKKDMISYRVTLKKQGQNASHANVELAQLTTTAAPKVGDTLDGAVMERYYEAGGDVKSDHQFKKAARGGFGGGGGRAWKPRPDDAPVVYAARQAQIVNQHSQDMALRVLELAHSSEREVEYLMAELVVEIGDEGLVAAFQRNASLAAGAAWKREADNGGIAKALAAIN